MNGAQRILARESGHLFIQTSKSMWHFERLLSRIALLNCHFCYLCWENNFSFSKILKRDTKFEKLNQWFMNPTNQYQTKRISPLFGLQCEQFLGKYTSIQRKQNLSTEVQLTRINGHYQDFVLGHLLSVQGLVTGYLPWYRVDLEEGGDSFVSLPQYVG